MKTSLLCVIAAVLFVAGDLNAQVASKPAAAAKVEPVTDQIPAGALGFIAIKDIAGAAAKAERYINDIGLGEPYLQALTAMGLEEPNKGMLSLLKLLPIGDGLNTSGGVAVVLLDPNAFGVDLNGMMHLGDAVAFEGDLVVPDADGGTPSPTPAAAPKTPATAPAAPGSTKPEDLPAVLIVAATGVSELLGGAADDGDGMYRVTLGPMAIFAGKVGNYVALGVNRKAVVATVKAAKRLPAELTKEQAAILAACDVAVRLNMNVAGPYAQRLVQAGEQQLSGSGPFFWLSLGPVSALYPQLPFYRYAMGEMESFTIGLRIEPAGVAADFLVDWKPQSLFAKAYGDCKDCGPLATLLPDRKHVFVIAAAPERGASGQALEAKRIESVMEALHKLSEDEAKRFKDIATEIGQQINQWELVAGGGEPNEGVFSVALVARGQDAGKIKKAISNAVQALPGGIFGAISGSGNEFDNHVSVEYTEAAEKVGEVAVDTVEFKPKDDVPEQALAEIEKVLAERKIRVFIASADGKTVVMTFGGGTKFLAEALKAAKGGGKISQLPAAAEAMKHLPDKASTLALFNGGNLYENVVLAYTTITGQEAKFPVTFSTKEPIAYGSAVIGKQKHGVLFVPLSVVKETVKLFIDMEKCQEEQFRQYRQRANEPAPMQPGKDDF